jgi:branched-chain amino acid transport system ATP-binding protein
MSGEPAGSSRVPDDRPRRGRSTALLTLAGVVAGHGTGDVLRGVDLTVAEGEVVCLTGPRGSGKTTLLMTIIGLLRPRAGDIRMDGSSILGLTPRERLRLGIVHVPRERSLFPGRTVWENLLMGAYVLRDPAEIRRRAERVAELFTIVDRRRNAPAGSLSEGEQRQVELARALMLAPRLVLLDEPTSGLASGSRRLVDGSIARLATDGRSILRVERDARSGLMVADRGAVLQDGAVRRTGDGRAHPDDPEVAGTWAQRAHGEEDPHNER